ncbi:oxidoreductase, partial [Arthrobacter deserti]|nr:oxidoreductase [Arthrobacter deserti]
MRAINMLAPSVKEFVLAPADGHRLASYAPGSHLVVSGPGKASAYSLTDDGAAPDAYRISVLRCSQAGLSGWLHDAVGIGDMLTVAGPRSSFRPDLSARHHLLVAAGIGITPILSHLRAARRWGRSTTVFYGHSADTAPHLDTVRGLAKADLDEAVGRKQITEKLPEVLAGQPFGTVAYACGPAGFLQAYTRLGRELGWPEQRLRQEHFNAPELEAGEPFTVTLARSGRRFLVPAGTRLLDVLDTQGVEVPRMCRKGVCGQCYVGIAAGAAVHRDLILSAAERDSNRGLYCCVSRGVGDTLALDL